MTENEYNTLDTISLYINVRNDVHERRRARTHTHMFIQNL